MDSVLTIEQSNIYNVSELIMDSVLTIEQSNIYNVLVNLLRINYGLSTHNRTVKYL